MGYKSLAYTAFKIALIVIGLEKKQHSKLQITNSQYRNYLPFKICLMFYHVSFIHKIKIFFISFALKFESLFERKQ